MKTFALVRHDRSVRKRFLQITRNRKNTRKNLVKLVKFDTSKFKRLKLELELRDVIYNDSDREQLEVHTYNLENLIFLMNSDSR